MIDDRRVSSADWKQQGACQGVAVQTFFPSDQLDEIAAKRICWRCAVVYECLNFAVDQDVRDGIWGATNEQERVRLRVAAIRTTRSRSL